MKTALARRIALGGPLKEELAQLREELETALLEGNLQFFIDSLGERILELEGRVQRLPFLDEVDLRYGYRVAVAAPRGRAPMFCLMDVSASMEERKKDLAKRFFTLLYLFLTRKYE